MENITDQNETKTCAEEQAGEYNLTLHLISLFSLLAFSALGVFLPIVAKRCATFINPENLVLIFGKFFGSGVMVATAFIHILPESVEALTNECLPEFFTTGYPAFAYLVTMLAALGLHLLEWFMIRVNLKNSGDKDNKEIDSHKGHGHAHAHRGYEEIEAQSSFKAVVATVMLEVAIAVHSVVIGVALGLSREEFVTLWIALSFHQFFEGIGVGFRAADLKESSTLFLLLTGFGYATTTPIGIAIGIGISVSTSQPTQASIIVQGIFEAVAAGLLLYSALVSLTAEEFATGSFHRMKTSARVVAFVAFYLGVVGMSIIGIWA